MRGIAFCLLLIVTASKAANEWNVQGADYNLASGKATCYLRPGMCDMFVPGTRLGSFPNEEERWQLVYMNVARMLPEHYATESILKNDYGMDTFECSSCECGEPMEHPYWLWQDGNEMARWMAYVSAQWTFAGNSGTGHTTPDDACAQLTDLGYMTDGCGFSARAKAFRFDGNMIYSGAEGLCGSSGSCLVQDGHCNGFYHETRHYVGYGFYPDLGNRDGIVNVFMGEYSHDPRPFGRSTNYPIVAGAHMDRRLKFWDTNGQEEGELGKLLEFTAFYFDVYNTASQGYVIYKGEKLQLEKQVEENNSSFWRLFVELPEDGCEPYFFWFETNNGTTYRLPQSNRYYFATSWPKTSWYYQSDDFPSTDCQENHYYDSGSEISANGGGDAVDADGQTLGITEEQGCVGCPKVAALKDLVEDGDVAGAEFNAPCLVHCDYTTPSGKCLKILDLTYNPTAESLCYFNYGGHVVSIGSQDDNDFLQGVCSEIVDASSSNIWIGLSTFGEFNGYGDWTNFSQAFDNGDPTGEEFFWYDGTPLNFTNWRDGRPDSGREENCAEMLCSNGQWDDPRYNCYYNGKRFTLCHVPTCDDGADAPASTLEPPTEEPSAPSPEPLTEIPEYPTSEPATTTSGSSSSDCNCSLYIGSKCAELVTELTTWWDAEDDCISRGGHISSIESQDENDQVLDYLTGLSSGPGNVWIGLNDIETEGELVWADGSTSDYGNWAGAEPTSRMREGVTRENCVAAAGSTLWWYDCPCKRLRAYFCHLSECDQ